MKPYIIQAFSYRHSSGGIKVLHRFCHLLNEKGVEAYVMADEVNSEWNTPQIHPIKAVSLLQSGEAVAVYPEVVTGNPYNARHVVRYVLNKPGLLAGDTTYPPSEYVMVFLKVLQQGDQKDSPILYIPTIEMELFNEEGATHHKKGCYYTGKGKKLDIGQIRGATEITRNYPSTRSELAQLLKDHKIFYCFDNLTALSVEAALCGTPTVIIPNGEYTKQEYEQGETSLDGVAWGTSKEELDHAMSTLGNVKQKYIKLYQDLDFNINNFVKNTQGRFQ